MKIQGWTGLRGHQGPEQGGCATVRTQRRKGFQWGTDLPVGMPNYANVMLFLVHIFKNEEWILNFFSTFSSFVLGDINVEKICYVHIKHRHKNTIIL